MFTKCTLLQHATRDSYTAQQIRSERDGDEIAPYSWHRGWCCLLQVREEYELMMKKNRNITISGQDVYITHRSQVVLASYL